MPKMIEYINPEDHTVQLSTPDKKIVKIPGKSKVILSEWYLNYCPKYLRVVRVIGENKKLTPKQINKNTVKYTPPGQRKSKITPNERRKIQNKITNKVVQRTPPRNSKIQAQIPNKIRKTPNQGPVVGRRARENTKKLFEQSFQENEWIVSNNIGVGILSYNRLPSLKRLIQSIRRHTDLSRTTIFVSDESTDVNVLKWLEKQKDIVVLTNQKQLGVAGNSNRLLRCLSRFRYGLLLNDDVEVLQPGWDTFYRNAAVSTGYHHFCYRQLGVYGAKRDGKISNVKGHRIETIMEKPHGAIMFFTNDLFKRIGYFDESFGHYGMEHVDWSNRASRAGFQPIGFHDVLGSDKFFKIHKEASAVKQRTAKLQKAKSIYNQLNNTNRLYINPTDASKVPSISVVIPLREINRQDAIRVVINSIRGQKFPNVEIIIAEQDVNAKLKINQLQPCKYLFAKNKYQSQPFTKAMAFNLGIANAAHNGIILQDGDIICSSGYVKKIYDILKTHEGIHIGSRVLYLTKDSTREVISTNKINKNNDCDRVVTYFEGGSLACTKRAYFQCGGFNEIFEGYGVEDCDFFDRLKYYSKFYNVRTEDFVHMWHGRTPGWQQHHRRNKKIADQLRKQYNMPSYISSLVKKLKNLYPDVYQKLATSPI